MKFNFKDFALTFNRFFLMIVKYFTKNNFKAFFYVGNKKNTLKIITQALTALFYISEPNVRVEYHQFHWRWGKTIKENVNARCQQVEGMWSDTEVSRVCGRITRSWVGLTTPRESLAQPFLTLSQVIETVNRYFV